MLVRWIDWFDVLLVVVRCTVRYGTVRKGTVQYGTEGYVRFSVEYVQDHYCVTAEERNEVEGKRKEITSNGKQAKYRIH